MLLESFSQAILRWLRVPPGASVRHNTGTSSEVDVENNDYIQTILDITVDDICIGDAPLSVSYSPSAEDITKKKLDNLCKEFNSVVKDIAYDLAADGFSVYDVEVDNKFRYRLFPYIDKCDFYLTTKKEVVVFDEEGKKQLKNKLIFINWNKRSLVKEEKVAGARFKIIPTPMQLKNAERTVSNIQTAENAIVRYRAMLRPARWANVDIGTAQGDQQKTTIDTIASAINCNSESLGNGAPFTEFDDNIPVLPNRKGLGKVEIAESIPTANIKELADLDYSLSKLNLIMRFPGTYMDFTKALSESAVSMIRGDLRYTKLVKAIQSKITNTINTYVQSSKYSSANPVFSLTTLPSSEDDDVMEAMDRYIELLDDTVKFIVGEDGTKEHMLQRLRMLQDLFSTSTTSPMLQKWFTDIEVYINSIDPNPLGDKPEGSASSTGLESEIQTAKKPGESPDIETFEEGAFNEEAQSANNDVELFEAQS